MATDAGWLKEPANTCQTPAGARATGELTAGARLATGAATGASVGGGGDGSASRRPARTKAAAANTTTTGTAMYGFMRTLDGAASGAAMGMGDVAERLAGS